MTRILHRDRNVAVNPDGSLCDWIFVADGPLPASPEIWDCAEANAIPPGEEYIVPAGWTIPT